MSYRFLAVSLISILSISVGVAKADPSNLLAAAEQEFLNPGPALKALQLKVQQATENKGYSSRLEKEIARYRVKFTVTALGDGDFDEDGLDGRSYYQYIVEPAFKNNEQVRKDIWVLDLRGNQKVLRATGKVKITFVRYFGGKSAKWDAMKAPIKWFWNAPFSTNDIKEKMAVNEGFRYELLGDIALGPEKVKELSKKFNGNLALAYARSGLIILDLHKFSETTVRSRFIGIKNRGEVRFTANTEQLGDIESLPGKLREWLSIGVGVNLRGTVPSFGSPTGIDSVLLDQVFNFETPKNLPKEKLKNDDTLAESALEEIFDNIKNGKLPLAFLTITKDGDLMRVLREVSTKSDNLAKTDYHKGRSQTPRITDARVINLFRGRTQSALYSSTIAAKISGIAGGKAQAGSIVNFVTTLDINDKPSHYWLDSNYTYNSGKTLFGRYRVDVLRDLDVLIQSNEHRQVGRIQDVVVKSTLRDTSLNTKQAKSQRKILIDSLPVHIKNAPEVLGLLKENSYSNVGIIVRKSYGHEAFVSIGSLNRPQLTMQLINFFENHPQRSYMHLPTDQAEANIGMGTFAEKKAHELASIFEPNNSELQAMQAYRIAKRDPLFEQYVIPEFLANLLPASAPLSSFKVDINVSSGNHGTQIVNAGKYQTSTVFEAVSYLRTLFTEQPFDTRDIYGYEIDSTSSKASLTKY